MIATQYIKPGLKSPGFIVKAAEWIAIAGSTDAQITDGKGRQLQSDAERSYVRSIIDAMATSFERDAVAKADCFDVRQHALDTLDSQIATAESALARLKEQKTVLQGEAGPVTRFKVGIESGRAREGEQSLDEVIEASSLSEALRLAATRFKQLNGRSDVQSMSIRIGAAVDDGSFVSVPSETFMPLFRSISQWDREAHYIEEARQKVRLGTASA